MKSKEARKRIKLNKVRLERNCEVKKVVGLLCVDCTASLQGSGLCVEAEQEGCESEVREDRAGLEMCTARLFNCGSVMRQHRCSVLAVMLRTCRTAGDSDCAAAPLSAVQVCGTLRFCDCQLCSLPRRTLGLLALIRGWASVLWYTALPFESHVTFDPSHAFGNKPSGF